MDNLNWLGPWASRLSCPALYSSPFTTQLGAEMLARAANYLVSLPLSISPLGARLNEKRHTHIFWRGQLYN